VSRFFIKSPQGFGGVIEDVLLVNSTQHHMVDAGATYFPAYSWHECPCLIVNVKLVTNIMLFTNKAKSDKRKMIIENRPQ